MKFTKAMHGSSILNYTIDGESTEVEYVNRNGASIKFLIDTIHINRVLELRGFKIHNGFILVTDTKGDGNRTSTTLNKALLGTNAPRGIRNHFDFRRLLSKDVSDEILKLEDKKKKLLAEIHLIDITISQLKK